ncbi:phenylalanine--tRNA ligase, beta subunit protein [Besnoitia besnoiti]|uniref:phenylalanine--tRNA ligase n=1 Tax=Besnoitia besnoiti TaxID=94643 RepID=A0A2A9M7Q0_BESBE|nr:phenylalanine--tRNA ligase, beta subunit protein [Besnoitia besnoiti]PFH33959.1 phenylalanine--tRNA ligase, beta subunit protein [Besnoitia besnoiti]
MPTVSVPRDELFRRLGRSYTVTEFDELCFEFGIELDEVVEPGTDGATETIYKIEVPANRYDLLCTEGISRALYAFNNPDAPQPVYRLQPATPQFTMTVRSSVKQVRPFVVCAILRGVKLTKESLASFIEFQDKLHHTLCRRRSLVAIGTHDFSKVQPPFVYDARPPKDLKFVPLGCDREMTGEQVMEHFSTHLQLKAYLPLIQSSPAYPLILDAQDRILSLPPIINAEFSKVTEATQDIFIECTAMDITKAQIVLNTLVAMFSEYCKEPYTVEPVQVVYEVAANAPVDRSMKCVDDDRKQTGDGSMNGWAFPRVDTRSMTFSLEYFRRLTGIPVLTPASCTKLLKRMMLQTNFDPNAAGQPDADCLEASIPITRSDILHERDIAEDVAIAYGFNKLPVTPSHLLTNEILNCLSEKIRNFAAVCGYTEALNFSLSSFADSFTSLGRMPAEAESCLCNPVEYQLAPHPVRLANSKTREFEQVRTTLIPGLLKTIGANRGRRELPIKLFELGDICVLDSATEVGARNLRYCCVAFADEHSSGLEEVHGVLDALMQSLQFVGDYAISEMEAAAAAAATEKAPGAGEQAGTHAAENLKRFLARLRGTFKLVPSHEKTFLPGRQVQIVASPKTADESESVPLLLGVMGTVHPHTLKAFGLTIPVSVLELNLEAFVQWLPAIDLVAS